MSTCPPIQPCPPPSPPPCPQVCPPPPPPAPCRVKPLMRGLHWTQTKGIIAQMLVLSAISGTSVYFLLGCPRRFAYKEYYLKAELEEWADEMARKGLFQSVPKGSSEDK